MMGKILTSVLLMVLISANVFAGGLKANFTYGTFNTPNTGPYIETYLSIVGSSAVFSQTATNTYQSHIEVTFIFKQDNQIKKFKKYNLSSPEIKDSLQERVNFIDQQRFSLPNGNYEFEVSIKDLGSNEVPFVSKQQLVINYPANTISISDIEFIETLKVTKEKTILTKNGYDIIPYTSDFYSEDFEKIAFYTEIYNTDKVFGAAQPFLLSYHIETSDNNKLVGNYKSFVRETANPVAILLKSFTIVDLPSGNYNLVIEVRNTKNELIHDKRIFFQRSNPSATPLLASDAYFNTFADNMSQEDLVENIKTLQPISSKIEIQFAENQLNGKEEDLMKQFFYNFWITRNELDPEFVWNAYKKDVDAVNKLFSTGITKGYEADRGRVYLKYGKPNTRTQVTSEPNSYPYEIWHYHTIKRFRNKRFVFYNRDMGTNEYPLLHSDMPGHIYNAQWKVQLHKRTNQPVDMETENNSDHYGGRANDYYNNPR
jgi:GWxTD domain-containing protein